jgi:hypothetical protein
MVPDALESTPGRLYLNRSKRQHGIPIFNQAAQARKTGGVRYRIVLNQFEPCILNLLGRTKDIGTTTGTPPR